MHPTTKRILEHVKDRGGRIPPAGRDIQHALGISSISIVMYHLDILETSGMIEFTYDRNGYRLPRTLELTPKGRGWTKIQIVGTLDANGIHLD